MADISIGDLKAWVCLNLKDNTPEGVYLTNTKHDSGLSVMVYVKDDEPVGVVVRENVGDDDFRTVMAWGWVPADEIE